MAEENHIIHIRLEPNEAVETRKGMLSTQIGLLKILTKMNEYERYKAREVEMKMSLAKRMKDLRTSFNDFEKILPKLKIPKIIRKQEQEKEAEVKKQKAGTRDESVEMQLHDIQRKLDALQGKSY